MLAIAVGHSEGVDEDGIVEEIIEQCAAQMDGLVPQAGMLFAAVDFEYATILEGILKRWPGTHIIGCTTDGEFSSELGFLDDSVALTLFASDTIKITTGVGRNVSANIGAATAEAIGQATIGITEAPRLCLTTPASLLTSSDQVVRQLKCDLGPEVVLLGALAGDQWRFDQTFQFHDREVLTDAVPIILFSGPVRFSKGVDSGWKPVGKIGTTTKVGSNVVYEIDGLPALRFYRDLLGDKAVPTGDRPLAILDGSGSVEYLRASIEQYDEEVGSVTFFGDVPEGAKVQITLASREEILDGTRNSVSTARDTYPVGHTPSAAIFFSCSGRKLLLGTKTGEEYKILRAELGLDIPVVGFYGYGEIGPSYKDQDICQFHNETFVTVLIGA
ncbi:MAG: FIST signal transduction protein [Rhizobiaceae bacterium]